MADKTVAEYKAALGGMFLHADDLLRGGQWCEATITIASVHEPESVRGGDKQLVKDWIVKMKERDKYVCLNKTNLRLIRLALKTEKLEQWVGQKITLYPVTGDWFGEKNTLSYRVRVPVGTPLPKGVRMHLGKDLTQDQPRVAKKGREPVEETREREEQAPEPEDAAGREPEFGNEGEGEPAVKVTTSKDDPDQNW